MGRVLSGIWRGVTVVRMALANLLFLAFLVVLWVVLRGGTPTVLPDRAALLLDPQGRVVDQRSSVNALSLFGQRDDAAGEVLLRDLIDAVTYAVDDPRITALVLDLGGLMYIGQSKALELSEVIERFRDSGKPVIATGDYYSQDQYRLAVEADHILMHPLGAVTLEGYGSYINYFAEALEKLSVTVHIFRAGEHKSFAEPFQRRDMSPGEKLITGRWLAVLWDKYTRDIEVRRELDDGAIDALINDYPARLRTAQGDAAALALAAGLVDELLPRQQRDEFLAAQVGVQDDDGNYESIAFDNYLSRMRPSVASNNVSHIALVTAQGNMLPGDQEAGAIGGDSLAALLREAASRPGVAALVLRINSGGGSVFAAEIIREEIIRIRSKGLPIVVSMGAIAASGGYYIAAESDRVYATEATLTGSIGVFAAFPTVDRLLARGGVYTDGVGTTALAGGLRPDRPINPLFSETIQVSVDATHEKFITLVADGRKLPLSEVRPIADGRVLAAQDALDLGLIDAIGGLEQAVEGAAEIAGLDDFQLIEIEPSLSPQQMMIQRLAKVAWLESTRNIGAGNVGAAAAAWLGPMRETAELLNSFADPGYLYMRCTSCGG
jgi:protease-4